MAPQQGQYLFLSTLPARGATARNPEKVRAAYISIHAPREGSDNRRPRSSASSRISIHAPREGSDSRLQNSIVAYVKISIHAPREGSDALGVPIRPITAQFLSTLPARGATSSVQDVDELADHFYPRSPRGERLVTIELNWQIAQFLSTLPARGATAGRRSPSGPGQISIHAPREGSDQAVHRQLQGAGRISIHAPREGSDGFNRACFVPQLHFYPRSPRGERPRRS